jgi:hypothetical protein
MAAMIVEIRLSRNADGSIDREAPFMVIAEDRTGPCLNVPAVIAQLAPDEDRGRFEATWEGAWKFGRRITDA